MSVFKVSKYFEKNYFDLRLKLADILVRADPFSMYVF